MSFLRAAKLLFPLSVIAVVGSIVLFFYPGPRLSIEFTGGTLMEVRVPDAVTKDALEQNLKSYDWKDAGAESVSVAKTANNTYFLRTPNLDPEQHKAVLAHLTGAFPEMQELQYTSIGPTVGASLERRALAALVVASLAIIVYLTIAFRTVPRELSPWSFGLAAVAALLHDLVIVMGIFTILSHTTSFQVDTLFVSAMLSIMGYSVMDTIVIFDRIRENLAIEGRRESFAAVTQKSVVQTLTRTMSTAVVTLIMLAALFLFGAESIRWFMLALILGTVIGTYSSFFVATPLIVYLRRSSR
jgi:preprotein translocase SecF subunit